jgi:hypothetical protein
VVPTLLQLAAAINLTTGLLPNTALMHKKVFDVLANHYEVTRRPTGTVTQRIAEVLGVQDVVVAYAIENLAQEGQANSYSAVHSTNCYIFYRPANPGVMVPTWGYQPRMMTPRTNPQGWSIRQLPDPEGGVTRVQLEWILQCVRLSSSAGLWQSSRRFNEPA